MEADIAFGTPGVGMYGLTFTMSRRTARQAFKATVASALQRGWRQVASIQNDANTREFDAQRGDPRFPGEPSYPGDQSMGSVELVIALGHRTHHSTIPLVIGLSAYPVPN